jgi:hypothetical protein
VRPLAFKHSISSGRRRQFGAEPGLANSGTACARIGRRAIVLRNQQPQPPDLVLGNLADARHCPTSITVGSALPTCRRPGTDCGLSEITVTRRAKYGGTRIHRTESVRNRLEPLADNSCGSQMSALRARPMPDANPRARTTAPPSSPNVTPGHQRLVWAERPRFATGVPASLRRPI